MDRMFLALIALLVGCADATTSPLRGGDPDAGEPRNGDGRISDVLGGGGDSEALGDAGQPAPDAGPLSGAAGSAPDVVAVNDGGSASPEIVDAGVRWAGCTEEEPCLLASIEIPVSTETIGTGPADLDGFSIELGSASPSEPFHIDSLSVAGHTLTPQTFKFSVERDEGINSAASYIERSGGWSGQATICAQPTSADVSRQCWYLYRARLQGLDGAIITGFVGVIDPLTVVQEGNDSSLATVGGRWEVWGY